LGWPTAKVKIFTVLRKLLLTKNRCGYMAIMKSKLILFSALGLLSLFAIPAVASDNPANDYLLTISPAEQAKILATAVGSECKGKKAFYQGNADDHAPGPNDAPTLPGHEHDSIWNVKCANGKSYVISVHPKGDSGVLECSVLEAMNGGHCFKKFK
jgi:hypothetical protein